MSIGNFVISSDCTWGGNHLKVPATGYAISEGAFQPNDNEYTISIVADIKDIVTSGNYSQVILAQGTSVNKSNVKNFCVYLQSSKIKFSYRYSNGSSAVETIEAPITVGKHVLDFVVSKTAGRMYIDGALATEHTIALTKVIATYKLGIGCYANDAGFTGNSSQAAFDVYVINLYTRPLTPEEIVSNFEAYNTRYSLGLQ